MTTDEEKQKPSKAKSSKTTAAKGTKKSTGTKRTRSEAGSEGAGAKAKSTSRSSGGRKSTRATAVAKEKAAKEATPDTQPSPAIEPRPLPRVLARFREEVAQEMTKEFGYTSAMQVPRLTKIVLNIGMGEALENSRAIENASRDLSLIAGQHPVTTRARKSIAGFKIRQGMPIGLSVTLRGRRMFEFFDRLVSSALPRIRDFRGLSREAFDGRGNYSLGIREHVIFPEIDYNSIDRIRGLEVSIVTTARTDREGLRLLEMLGVPLARPETGEQAA